MRDMKEKIIMKIAWALPKELAYWVAIRVIAYGTQGQYGNQSVPEFRAMDALQRWRTQ